jgi:hypothetical protein
MKRGARLLFTRAEPFLRARFPRDAVRARVPLEWPPPDAGDESESEAR